MAGKRLKLDDFRNKVTPISIPQQKKTLGGYKLVSPGAGSIGQIQWDEIDFRNFGEDEDSIPRQLLYNRPSRPFGKK